MDRSRARNSFLSPTVLAPFAFYRLSEAYDFHDFIKANGVDALLAFRSELKAQARIADAGDDMPRSLGAIVFRHDELLK